MCGLVGVYSSNMLSKHKDVLSMMLYLDTWRGRDSTGVAIIRHNADTDVIKQTIPGYEFVEGNKLSEALKLNDFCWIGHNRAGTIGKNIKTNSHPFMIEDKDGCCILVGAHNGTLKNKHALTDSPKFGTDSEALFNEIALNGIEEAIKKTEGAWALSYYDHIEEELRFLRNDERPLFYAFSEDRRTLFWASEAWMIRVPTSRAGIKLHEDNVRSFAVDTLYKFPAPMKLNEELTFERQGGLVGKTTTFFQGYGSQDWRNWPRNRTSTFQQGSTGGATGHGEPQSKTKEETSPTTQNTSGTAITVATSSTQSGIQTDGSGEKQKKTRGSSSEPQSNDKSDNKVVAISSAKTYKGYAGVLLSANELRLALDGGCAWCELEFIRPTDKFAWLAPDKPVCTKCLEGTHEDEFTDAMAAAGVTVH